jgi:nitrile hydratase subunit alpha
MSAHVHGADVSNRVKALVARLGRAGVTTEGELDESIDRFLSATRKETAYRIVAKAWADPSYKARLLANGNEALAELGVDLGHWSPVMLRVVENTPQTHNIVVCTLCSCYPIALLGPSPSWYKSEAYRARAVRDPRGVLAEFGVTIPREQTIAVWDSTAEVRYMVLPQRPDNTDQLDETQLASLVTRDALIGTAIVSAR